MKLLILLIIVLFATTAAVVAQTTPRESARDNLERGLTFLKEEKYTEALDAFRASVRLEPSQSAAHANIGLVLLALNRPAEAVPAFREAIKLVPTEGSFQTALCRALTGTKNYTEAISACEEGVRLSPSSAEARIELVAAMKAAKRPQADILAILDLAVAAFRANEIVLEAAADYYAEIGNTAYAAQLFEQLTRLRPSSGYYFARLAETYLTLEREEEALAAARKALELEPNNVHANYFMGRLYYELGLHREAADTLSKIVSHRDANPLAAYFYASSLSNLGRNREAIDILKRLVARDPDEYEYQLQLATTLSGESRYEEAVAPARRALELRPNSLEAHATLGLVLFESADFERAIPVLEEADRRWPANYVLEMYLRVARSRQKNVPQIDDMKRQAKADPTDLNVRISLVELLSFSRRIDEVEPYVAEVLAMKPTEVKAYQRIAVAYSTAGRRDKALAMYQTAQAVKDDMGNYLGLSGIYQKMGKLDEAARAYAKIIELKPDASMIMKLYADLLNDMGRRREALDMYKRSLSFRPLDPPLLFNAGVLSYKLGERTAALQYLEILRTVDPTEARRLERCIRLRLWN